jgi:hypothetical protein
MGGTRGEAIVVHRVMLLCPVFGWLGGPQSARRTEADGRELGVT